MNFLNWLLSFIFDRKQVQTIDAAFPATLKLAAIIKQAEPLIAKAVPLGQEAAKELELIWPAIEIVLNKYSEHKKKGIPPGMAAQTVHMQLKAWQDRQNAT